MASIDRYLKYAVTMGASDLHLAGNTRPMMRLHGTMMPALGDQTEVLGGEEMASLVDEIMPNRSKEELEQVPGLLALIQERGYSRGRDLQEAWRLAIEA